MHHEEILALGKAHVAGVGNLYAHGPLTIRCGEDASVLLVVDSDTDTIAIELSPKAVEVLWRRLAATEAA